MAAVCVVNPENVILNQKIQLLTVLCAAHKSKYEQIRSKFEVIFAQTTEKHNTQITALEQRIHNQKLKLISKETEINQSKQQLSTQDLEYCSKIKLLQHKIDSYSNDLNNRAQNTRFSLQQKRIQHLQSELSQKNEEISHLKEQLRTVSDQYRPYASSRSPTPSTIKMTQSISISRISPNNTPIRSSPEISALKAKFYNKSPMSSFSSSTHAQIHPFSQFRQQNFKSANKWSDNILNSKPPPIDVSTVERPEWKTPTTDIEHETSDTSADEERSGLLLQINLSNSNSYPLIPSISPFIPIINANVGITPQSQGSASSANLIKILISETEISEDPNVAEDVE